MLKFIKFFQGYLFVSLSGYSPERFLNLCGKMNIVLWNLEPSEEGYTFCLSRKAYSMLDGALLKTGTQIHVIKRTGLPFLLHKYRKHSFFVVGLFCAFFVLFFMAQFIWKVEIDGNSYYSSQVLLEFLEENGIGYATPIKQINCKELQTMLRAEYDDITWVSAKIEGTRLYLAIQERLKGGDSQEESSEADTPAHLVSGNDGVVESITTRRGTPLVSAGDTVSEGKKKYNVTLIFGSHYLELLKFKDLDGCIEMETVYPVVIGQDFYLPFQIVKTELVPYVIQTGSWSEDEVKELAQEQFNQYCKKLKEKSIQILSNSVIIEQSGDEILVSGDLEVLVKQDTYQEISSDERKERT